MSGVVRPVAGAKKDFNIEIAMSTASYTAAFDIKSVDLQADRARPSMALGSFFNAAWSSSKL